MSRSLPPLNWFRAFECAARQLSFTAAAELNLTQSAISQHVRSLELRFGTALFVRKARGLALTDAGRRLLPYVSGAIADLAAATAVFEPHKTDDVLRIACSTSFALLWLAPRLNRFLDSQPGTDVRIVSTLWPDDYRLSEADLQIRFGAEELVGDSATLLVADVILPVCAPGQSGGLTSWAKICRAPLVQTVGTSDNWQTWADSLGLDPPPAISRSVDSYALAMAFARTGVGIALVSRMLAEPAIAAGELAVPVTLSAPAKDNYYIALREGAPKAALAKTFEGWLLAEIADHGLPGGGT